MPRVLPTLTIAFGLTAAGSLLYAWQLHGRLLELEIEAVAKAREVAALRAQLSAPEDRGPASAEPGPEGPALSSVPPSGSSPAMGVVNAGRQEGRNEADVSRRNSPELQRLMALQRRNTLDGRYATLFRNLKLSPADLEKFKDLLVDRQSAAMDVFNTARDEGLNPRENREQIRQLIESFEAETDASIRATLGETAYQQYQQYEQSFPQRTVVNQVEQRLSYSGAPLYGNQAEQLVSLLAASSPARSNATTALSGTGRSGASGGRQVAITDTVIAQSEGFLSQPQIAALRQLQQEQAAQATLQQQLQQSRRNNAGATRPPSSTGTGP